MPEYARPPRSVGPSRWDLPDPARVAGDVVGLGADLEAATLVDSYRRGIFPWPHGRPPLPWFSPDPRGVIALNEVKVSRTLRRTLKRSGWSTTVDSDFASVIATCAAIARQGEGAGTWINREMRLAYRRLNDLGWAHSVEVWDGKRLVGGLYGVQAGGVFTGESMFHRESDASKVALVDLADRMAEAGGAFIDIQIVTPHLASLGAVEIVRSRYLEHLAAHRDDHVLLPVDRRPVSRLAPPSP